jgi:hypothetical protein
MERLCIHRRFCGPPGMGNGGYVCGLVARTLGPAAEVTLRAPAPLDTELSLDTEGEGAILRAPDGTLVAEGERIAPFELAQPEPVSFAQAEQASRGYIGFRKHPYPGCFVCGTERGELGPGLALFPGPVERPGDVQVVAAPFVPAPDLCGEDGLLDSAFVWAALDCPSWFGYASFVEHPPKTLLGRLSVVLAGRPRLGESCVVLGFFLGQEGRRVLCGSALYGEAGACLAYARATWVMLK